MTLGVHPDAHNPKKAAGAHLGEIQNPIVEGRDTRKTRSEQPVILLYIDRAGLMVFPVEPSVCDGGGAVVALMTRGAGSGVRGYGNLLIIKHDEVFLSAYAHNSKLLVKEGDAVRAGQTIAEIGDSGTDRVKLHFEVRRKGSPVDPTKILPRR